MHGVIGISRNKLVSRIITAINPEPIYKIEAGEEAQFLAPLNPSFLPSAHIKYVNSIIHFLMIKKIKDIQSIANNYKYFQENQINYDTLEKMDLLWFAGHNNTYHW